jgi:small-conductance mechanosensitive channel
MDNIIPYFKEYIINYVNQNWLDMLKRIVLTTVIFIGFYFLINRFANKVTNRIINWDIQSNNKYTKRLWFLVWRIIYIVWLIFNILIACEILWIDVSLLMAWISLWIWFAMETWITNIISGFFILTNKKFKIWDFVELLWKVNTRWTVEEINLKHTIIKWIDNRRLLIPNSVMADTTIKTLKSEDLIRWDIEISLPRYVNIDQIKKLMNETTNNYENTMHKEYTNTFIESFDENWYKFHTIFFINPNKCSAMVAGSNIRIALCKVFKKYWISNPYKHLVIDVNQ